MKLNLKELNYNLISNYLLCKNNVLNMKLNLKALYIACVSVCALREGS